MASYGIFLTVCGYEYHGPKGHIGFAPKLSSDNFRAAFTVAEGWGSYSQRFRAAFLTQSWNLNMEIYVCGHWHSNCRRI
jgi:hypothetical protein